MSRILLITHIYLPAIDGGSQAIAQVGNYLAKKHHQTLVLTSNCYSTDDFVTPGSKSIDHLQSNIISLPVYKKISRFLKIIPPFHKGPIFKIFPFVKAFIRIIKFRPDYIFAGPLPTTIIIYAYLFKIFTKSKLIICPCFHPDDPDFNNSLLLKIISKSNFLWCLTSVEKKLLHHPRTIIKGLGVDSNFLINQSNIKFPKNPNILFIGNFAAHKKVELLVDAYHLLKQKYPKLTLTLLGQKTLHFSKINISSDIKLILSPSREQIKKSLDSASLLCLPSIHESFGIVFCESLARGKPVIGADSPQTSEVINLLHGGVTFQKNNLSDLVSKLDLLLNHPQKLGTSGFNYVKNNLTWDRIGEYLCQNIGL